MAEYRTLRKSFWQDPYVENIDAGMKLLYLYLITNSNTNNVGLMEISHKRIAYETGLEISEIKKYLSQMEEDKKLVNDGNFILLLKFIKHQCSTSPKIIDGLKYIFKEIESKKIKESLSIEYNEIFSSLSTTVNPMHTPSVPNAYPIDTLSIPYQNPIDTIGGIGKGKGKEELRNKHIVKLNYEDTEQAKVSNVCFLDSENADFENSCNKPSLEYLQLRDAYSLHARPEPVLTGHIEFKKLVKDKRLPPMSRLLDDIAKRFDKKNHAKGYAVSFARYLREEHWNAEIQTLPTLPSKIPKQNLSAGELSRQNGLAAIRELKELEEQTRSNAYEQ